MFKGTAGVKRHRECVAFRDALNLQPVKYTRPYDESVAGIDFQSHHRLLDQTRDLPCKDIINEGLRPLAGSYDIELSLHRENDVKDRDRSVSQRVEQSSDVDHLKQRLNQVSDHVISSRRSVPRATLPGDDQSLNERHLSTPTSSHVDNIQQHDIEISRSADFPKVYIHTGDDKLDSAINGREKCDRRKPSRIDRLNQRQPGLCSSGLIFLVSAVE